MNKILAWTVLLLVVARAPGQESGTTLISGLKNPSSVAIDPGGRVYVSVRDDLDKDGIGAILVLDKAGKAAPFASGLDDPRGIAAYNKWLFVADRQRIWRIDPKGKADVFVPAKAFPSPPIFLTGITADPESGMLYV